MRRLSLSLFSLLVLISCNEEQRTGNGVLDSKVVYGRDDRHESVFLSDNELQEISKSTAGMIVKDSLKDSRLDGHKRVARYNLKDVERLCHFQRFRRQPTIAYCSGFLIAPDLLMTAGHCIRTEKDCKQFSWVFDFDFLTLRSFKSLWLKEDNIYNCIEVIKREQNESLDYAIIKLDREVEDREPMKLRTEGIVHSDAQLALMGHPNGLPLKVATNGKVRNNDYETVFTTTVDSFAGNSGGPVVNMETGVVEGILVSGEDDYVETASGCFKVNRCKEDECMGESVIRINQIPILETLLKR